MKQILSIILSLSLLASHTYLTIGTHFCGGEAVESKIILGQTHLGCAMMAMEESCDDMENPLPSDKSFNKPPCCENEYQTLQTTSEFVKDVAQVAFSFEFAAVLFYSTLNWLELTNSHSSCYFQYHSPPIEKDIPVLFQAFLS